MEPNRTQSRGRGRSNLIIALGVGAMFLLGVCSLTACGASPAPEKLQQPALPAANVADNPPITTTVTTVPTVPTVPTVSDTVTPVPTNTAGSGYPPTIDPNGRAEFQTAVAEFDNRQWTAIALTHAPTWTPGEPPIYPTEPPAMGLFDGCANANSRGPQCLNVWQGMINGEIVAVRAGREGSDGDSSQGLITVNNLHTHAFDIYRGHASLTSSARSPDDILDLLRGFDALIDPGVLIIVDQLDVGKLRHLPGQF